MVKIAQSGHAVSEPNTNFELTWLAVLRVMVLLLPLTVVQLVLLLLTERLLLLLSKVLLLLLLLVWPLVWRRIDPSLLGTVL